MATAFLGEKMMDICPLQFSDSYREALLTSIFSEETMIRPAPEGAIDFVTPLQRVEGMRQAKLDLRVFRRRSPEGGKVYLIGFNDLGGERASRPYAVVSEGGDALADFIEEAFRKEVPDFWIKNIIDPFYEETFSRFPSPSFWRTSRAKRRAEKARSQTKSAERRVHATLDRRMKEIEERRRMLAIEIRIEAGVDSVLTMLDHSPHGSIEFEEGKGDLIEKDLLKAVARRLEPHGVIHEKTPESKTIKRSYGLDFFEHHTTVKTVRHAFRF